MGYYQAKPISMAKLRARIDRDPKKFETLIAPLIQQKEFILEGDDYKRKKEAPTVETSPWYNKKSFALTHRQKNGKELFSPKLADRLVKGYQFLMPFYEYMITLDTDPEGLYYKRVLHKAPTTIMCKRLIRNGLGGFAEGQVILKQADSIPSMTAQNVPSCFC